MSVEEYIQYELKSEVRHEYINGQLVEMADEPVINNRIVTFLIVYLFPLFSEKGYSIYTHNMKVAIEGENKYYYPDFLLTREPDSKRNDYVQYEPELIVEISSKASRTWNLVYKYLDYIKIPSLKYYLVIESGHRHITFYAKDANGEWEAEAYSEKTDIISLPLLETELPLSIIYR